MIQRMVSIATLLLLWGCSFGMTFPEKFEALERGMRPDDVMATLGTSNRLIDSMEVQGITVRTDRYIVEIDRWVETTQRWNSIDKRYEDVNKTKYKYEDRYLAFVGDSLFTWGTLDDYLFSRDLFIAAVGKAIKNK